jgi:hypothetical protein
MIDELGGTRLRRFKDLRLDLDFTVFFKEHVAF